MNDNDQKNAKKPRKPINKGKGHNTIRALKLKKFLQEGARSLKEASLRAGYAPSTAKSTIYTTKHAKESRIDVLDVLKEKRLLLLEGITESKVRAMKDVDKLASGAKKVSDIHEVLSGGVSERVEYVIVEGDIVSE